MSERSSGDGGSDKETGHYATVGRRMRCEEIYSSMRRPDGKSDYDPYSSIRLRREPDEVNYESVGSEEQLYETLHKQENEKSISSEASSVSQATVRRASTEPSQANMADLYARVDMNKKRNRNSDSSLSPTPDTMSPTGQGVSQTRLILQTVNQPDMTEVQHEASDLTRWQTPVPLTRSVAGVRVRQDQTPDT